MKTNKNIQKIKNNVNEEKNKKPFNKKKYREQKYSHKNKGKTLSKCLLKGYTINI